MYQVERFPLQQLELEIIKNVSGLNNVTKSARVQPNNIQYISLITSSYSYSSELQLRIRAERIYKLIKTLNNIQLNGSFQTDHIAMLSIFYILLTLYIPLTLSNEQSKL